MSLAESSIVVVDTSPAEPVSLEMVRQHCRVVSTDEDDLLRFYLSSARDFVSAETGMVLVRSTIRERFSKWRAGDLLELTAWPAMGISSIVYYDANGELEILAPEAYRQAFDHRPAAIISIAEGWPSFAINRPDAITVTYTAGFDPASRPAPEAAKQAILLLVGHSYRTREAVVVGSNNSQLELGVERLIDLCRSKRYP